MKQYVAFFDIDRTIISTNSGKIIAQQAFKKGLLTKKDLFQGLYLSLLYKIGIMSPKKIINSMGNWLEGVPEANFIKFSDQIFAQFIKHTIKPQAKSEIEYHKNNHGDTVILSAALSYICLPIKELLNIDGMICTQLEVIEGRLSGHPKGNYCYGYEKLKQAKQYCTKHNFSLDQAYYYADSISDLPLLQDVGYPMCVNPRPKLERIAKKNGWTILNW